MLRGDGEIKVDIGIIRQDEFQDLQDPDYFVIYFSKNEKVFNDSLTAKYYEPYVILENLENGDPVFVKIKTYKEGFETLESGIRVSIADEKRQVVIPDFVI